MSTPTSTSSSFSPTPPSGSDINTITNHLKTLYASYRATPSIPGKAVFFSKECMQICAPQPSYAASGRETIISYLEAASNSGVSIPGVSEKKDPKREGYTIRPLRLAEDEFTFETDEVVAHAGVESVDALKERALREQWVGMRVDLWFEDESEGGMLCKVQYWWRKEDGTVGEGEGRWVQILHDIMYMGLRDGTEGTEGDEVLQ
ncbi:hypothetical protein QBC35DRAFT_488024 [Podospora australis]|uniref:SnoaL-like domain-containing protein n=1 Tax=Podospora australis TaxID=1536484 RepID=A0AAN6X2S3_9PEZI|nr:hypothetical protein QBC35DRAFT_488024 [Podospora australis]